MSIESEHFCDPRGTASAYLFELFVAGELNSTVGHNADNVRAIASHKAEEPFFYPHLA